MVNEAAELSTVTSESFLNTAANLVDAAKTKGITLRIMGAVAFRIHGRNMSELHVRLERLGPGEKEFTDIDLAAYSRDRNAMQRFFESQGFAADRNAQLAGGGLVWSERHIYHEPKMGFHVDVFFDKLNMCHLIPFKNRLEADYPTLPLAELLLEKMQIVEINEKDLKDAIFLIRTHEIGESDAETINGALIARLLAQEWGFYYTVKTNFDKLIKFSEKFQLTAEERADVISKVEKLKLMIESQPKGLSWKMRAKIGPSRKWYNDVDAYFD